MAMHPAVELACDLVRHPTFPGSGGQASAAAAVAERLETAGFDVQLHEYAPGHANVVAVMGNPAVPGLCFTGHLDTVAIDEAQWSVDPLGAVVADGRLWGRGAVDMKSGVAAAVHALIEHAAAVRADGRTVAVVITAEEEVGCRGARSAVEAQSVRLPEVAQLVVCEPTSNRPEAGHRGALWLDLRSTGRASHASTPHLGVNAFTTLTTALGRIDEWLGEHPSMHPDLGPRTMNIGVVHAGIMRNIVPDEAVAELDIRLGDAEELTTLVRDLEALLDPGVAIEPILALPPVWTDPSQPWFRRLLRHADELTQPGPVRAARFFTDASVLTPTFGDVPTVILGPGSADLAHAVDESCPLEEIPVAVELYRALLRRGA